jgi:hypothetical protein
VVLVIETYLPKNGFAQRPLMRAFIHQGMTGLWFSASYCSCWGKRGKRSTLPTHTAQGNPDCPICDGAGYLYAVPQTVYPTVFSKVIQQVSYDAGGQNPAGVAKWLVPEEDGNGQPLEAFDQISINDLVVPLDIVYQASESVTKGEDVLRRFPITITDVIYQGQTLQYTYNNNIILVDLPPGETYTVRYAYHPIYVIREEVGQARQFGGRNLPRTFHLLERAPIGKTEYQIFSLLGDFKSSHAVR